MAASDNLSPKQFDRLSMGAPIVKNLGIVAHDPKEDDTEEGFNRTEAMYANKEHHHPGDMWDMPASEELHTTQSVLNKSTIRHFVDNPNNPEEWKDGEGYNAPEVYTHQGKLWVHEGHHRLIASRLRGDSSTKVHHWDTGE